MDMIEKFRAEKAAAKAAAPVVQDRRLRYQVGAIYNGVDFNEFAAYLATEGFTEVSIEPTHERNGSAFVFGIPPAKPHDGPIGTRGLPTDRGLPKG